MFHKSKSKRVLAVILLLIGIIPDNIDCLKCYSCNGTNCDAPGTQEMKECVATMGACITTTAPGFKKKDCVTTAKSECIKTKGGGGGCYIPASDSDRTKLGEINTCIGDNTGDHVTEEASTCVCNSDLCNADSGTGPSPTSNTGSKGKGGDVKCYSCSGDPYSPCWTLDPTASSVKIEQCEACMLKKVIPNIERGCIDDREAKCLIQLFGGCINLPYIMKNTDDPLENCVKNISDSPRDQTFIQELVKKRPTLEDGKHHVQCACLTDLCNGSLGLVGQKLHRDLFIYFGILLTKVFQTLT